MFIIFFSTLILWIGLLSHPALGQHVHDDHPVTLHSGYHRASLEGPGHSNPIVTLDSTEQYLIFSEWLINSTCNEIERGNSYTKSVVHTVHVGVEGELEWGAEAGAKILAAELKTFSKARVQLNGGWSGQWKESLTFSSKVSMKKCQKIWFIMLKNRYAASGEVESWEHKITCIKGSAGDVALNYCNKKVIKGKGVGWGTHIGEHVQRGLVHNCPCSDVDPDTTHVFTPTVPVPVPDPNPKPEEETTGPTTPVPEPEKPKYVVQNPIKKEIKDEGKK